MFTWLRKILAPPVFEGDEDKTRIANVLNSLLLSLLGMLIIGAIAVPFVFAAKLPSAIAILALFVALLISKLLMHTGRVQQAGLLLVVGLWVPITGLVCLSGGMDSVDIIFYVVLTVMAGLLLGQRAAIVVAVVNIMIGLGTLILEGIGYPLPRIFPYPTQSKWIMLTIALLYTTTPLNLAIRSITEALERARQSNHELQAIRASLEERVEERTRDLARRTHYLEATAAIVHGAASVLNLEELLRRVVSLISEQFGFYHTGIFLLDPAREWAVLQAASSEGGKQMLARGHRLPVSGKSIVGYVTSRGEPRIALDVEADAVFFQNPDLPDTRSEIALPLRARGRAGREASDIIGALDVQSTQPQAFGQEDIAILQTLADQVAMAISNAQLFQQAQEGLEVERRAAAQLTGQAWQELFHAQRELSVVRSKHGLATASELQRPEIATARRTGKVTVDENTKSNLAAPVKVRDHVIGVIDAHKAEGAWTPEEIVLVESLTEQMGVALESARLYQDTQRGAARERLSAQITAHMRETLDVDAVLQTAVREISAALGLVALDVHLGVEAETIQDSVPSLSKQ